MTRSMAVSRAYRSATHGLASTARCAAGNRSRTARMAGSDMTASPSQFVARIRILLQPGSTASRITINPARKERVQGDPRGQGVRPTLKDEFQAELHLPGRAGRGD